MNEPEGMMLSSSKLMGLIATIVGNYHIHDTTNKLLKSKSIERSVQILLLLNEKRNQESFEEIV